MTDKNLCTTTGEPVDKVRAEQTNETGQHKGYVILCDAERARGFVKPCRTSYRHRTCGTITTMGRKIAETYARDPRFYNATFCVGCNRHLPLSEFAWEPDGEPMDPNDPAWRPPETAMAALPATTVPEEPAWEARVLTIEKEIAEAKRELERAEDRADYWKEKCAETESEVRALVRFIRITCPWAASTTPADITTVQTILGNRGRG